MSINDINDWFEKFGRFQIKYRWPFIIVLMIITILLSAGLPRLRMGDNAEQWLDDYDTVHKNEERFKDLFGGTDSLMVHITADDVFAPDVLNMIDKLGDRLLAEVPYAESELSILNVAVPVGTSDGIEVNSPFGGEVPDSAEEIAEKKDFLLNCDSVVNMLVSKDATETWMIINMESYSESLNKAMYKIAPAAIEVFKSPEFISDKWQIRPIGESYTRYLEESELRYQFYSRILVGFFVMVMMLMLFTRSLFGVVIPVVATVFALSSVMGANAWLGAEGAYTTLMLVVLMTMALSVGYATHYINAFRLRLRQQGNRRESAILAVRDSGWALLFTVITTMAGMLASLFGGIVPLRWGSIVSAASVFSVYLYTMVFLPCLLSMGKDRIPVADNLLSAATRVDLGVERFGAFVLKYKWPVLLLSTAFIASMIPGVFRVDVNLDYVKMVGDKTPYIRELIELSEAQLGREHSYDVLIEYDEEDVFKQPEMLRKLDEMSVRIGKLPMTKVSGDKPRAESVLRIVKGINRVLNEDNPDMAVIPDSQELIAQELLLYEMSGGEDLYQFVNSTFSAARIHVDMKSFNSVGYSHDLRAVEAMIDEFFPDRAGGGVIGKVMHSAVMTNKFVQSSMVSIGASFIIIFLLMLVAFGSFQVGAVSMIPNIAPMILVGGVMGYSNISLDFITALIIPMILGIAIDDTIHFTNHIKYHYEQCGDYRKAILAAYREIGKTMCMTTLVLCGMFVIFLFSRTACMVRTGYIVIVGLTGALVSDYTITPVLILILKPFTPKGLVKNWTVNINNIGEKSEIISGVLTKMNAAKREITNSLLLLEETVVRLINSGAENVEVRAKRFLGDVSLELSAKGEQFNPLDASSNLDVESEEYYRDMIFRANEELLGWSRRGNKNNVSIRVHSSDNKAAYLTFIAMIFGIINGIGMRFLPPEASAFICDNILSVVQTLFMNALMLFIAPIVFFSITTSLMKLSGNGNIGRIGGRAATSFTVTSLISLVIGIVLAVTFFSGDITPLPLSDSAPADFSVNATNITFKGFITGIIPKNLVSPILGNNMMQLLFISILVGIVMSSLGEKVVGIRQLFTEMNVLFTKLIGVVIRCMPLVALSAMAMLTCKSDLATLRALLGLFAVIVIGLVMIFIMNVIILSLFARDSLRTYLRNIPTHLMTTFSLGSSSATIPTSLALCKNKLGISDKVSAFVIPLGSVVNMNGTCMCVAMTTIVLAKMSGIDIDTSLLVKIGILSFLLAVGMPGIHNGSLICIAMVLSAINAPIGAVSAVFGVWEIVTRMLVATNVNGDVVTSILVNKDANSVADKKE